MGRRSAVTGHVFRANKYRAWLRPRLPSMTSRRGAGASGLPAIVSSRSMLHLPVLAPTNTTLNGGIGQQYCHRRGRHYGRFYRAIAAERRGLASRLGLCGQDLAGCQMWRDGPFAHDGLRPMQVKQSACQYLSGAYCTFSALACPRVPTGPLADSCPLGCPLATSVITCVFEPSSTGRRAVPSQPLPARAQPGPTGSRPQTSNNRAEPPLWSTV